MVDNSAGSEFQVAEAYAYFGNVDQAFAWLDRASRVGGSRESSGCAAIPCCATLRADPRYASIAYDG